MADQNGQQINQIGGLEGENGAEFIDGGDKPLEEVVEKSPEEEQNQLEGQLEEMEKKSVEFRSKADSLGLLPDSIETEDPFDLRNVPYSPFYNKLDESDVTNPSDIIGSPTKREDRLKVINEQLAEPTSTIPPAELLREKQALLVAQGYVDTFLMRNFVIEKIREQAQKYSKLQSTVTPEQPELLQSTVSNKDDLIHLVKDYIALAQTSETYFTHMIPESLKRFERKNPEIATPFLQSANEVFGKAIGVETRVVGPIPSDQEEQHTLETFIDQLNLENMPQTLADFKNWLNELEAEIPQTVTDTTPRSDTGLDQSNSEGEAVGG